MTDDDEQMMSDLLRVLDTVDATTLPDVSAAQAAFAWRDMDAELAQLVFDSEHDVPADVVVRGEDEAARQLTFTTGDVTIDIEIGPDGLMGQIIPPHPASIELHQSGRESVHLETDRFGVFSVSTVAAGPTTIVARALDESWSIRTAWTAT